jgi:hypothetical protein
MGKLGLTRKADGQKIKKLICCAHFVQFPERHTSELNESEMISALALASAPAEQIVDTTPEIDWLTEIVQQGFDTILLLSQPYKLYNIMQANGKKMHTRHPTLQLSARP